MQVTSLLRKHTGQLWLCACSVFQSFLKHPLLTTIRDRWITKPETFDLARCSCSYCIHTLLKNANFDLKISGEGVRWQVCTQAVMVATNSVKAFQVQQHHVEAASANYPASSASGMDDVISLEKYAVTSRSLNNAWEAADHPSRQHIGTLPAATTPTRQYWETLHAQECPLEHPWEH